MGTFAEIAIADYRLSFAERKTNFRFPFPFAANKREVRCFRFPFNTASYVRLVRYILFNGGQVTFSGVMLLPLLVKGTRFL